MNSNSSEDPSRASVPLISVAGAVKETWVELRSASLPVTPSPLRMVAKSCVERKFVFSSSLIVLGQVFDMVFEEDGGLLTVGLVEDSETKLAGFEVGQDVKDALCRAQSPGSDNIVLLDNEQHAKLTGAITAAMQKMVPDCKSVTVASRSVKCHLEQLSPQLAIEKAEDFQKAMIRKWSRQPYILARRTGVVSTLARSAMNFSNEDGFTKFCKVLQFSLPEELPIVMTSHRWRSALCSGQTDVRKEAAFYGLAKGVHELWMLRELYEQTSREGMLSIKIPLQTIPGRAVEASKQPLRITIAPDENVSKKLVDEARQYLGRPADDDFKKRFIRGKRGGRIKVRHEPLALSQAIALTGAIRSDMCWHPVYGESTELVRIADGMKLTGEGFQFECGYLGEREPDPKIEMAALSRYLLQSLSSETEFVIDNGQSKLLRLPEGTYQYTVHVLPANPLDSEDIDDEMSPKSTGELGWGSTRNHAIRVW
jgi:hypothetical protein